MVIRKLPESQPAAESLQYSVRNMEASGKIPERLQLSFRKRPARLAHVVVVRHRRGLSSFTIAATNRWT